MSFKDAAFKAKNKNKKRDMSAEDALGKFKDDHPFPKGASNKKGGFKAAAKNAKKKFKGKKSRF